MNITKAVKVFSLETSLQRILEQFCSKFKEITSFLADSAKTSSATPNQKAAVARLTTELITDLINLSNKYNEYTE